MKKAGVPKSVDGDGAVVADIGLYWRKSMPKPAEVSMLRVGPMVPLV